MTSPSLICLDLFTGDDATIWNIWTCFLWLLQSPPVISGERDRVRMSVFGKYDVSFIASGNFSVISGGRVVLKTPTAKQSLFSAGAFITYV